MATLLLARPDKASRGQDLRRTLLHLLHGFQAIENALTTFIVPFSSHKDLLAIAGQKDILADFDAHVGDTACHMRAQMIWQVYEYHKYAQRRTWMHLALVALARVKAETIALLLALHKRNGYMRALGFGTIVSYGQIFDRIGWSAFIDMFDKRPSFSLSDMSDSESCESDVSTPMPGTPPDLEPIQFFQKYDTSMIPMFMHKRPSHNSISSEYPFPRHPISRSISSSSASSPSISETFTRTSSPFSSIATTPDITHPRSKSAISSSSHGYRSITANCTWDVTNHLTVLRFLTLCRLLSVGKRAKVQSGFPNAAIRARTDPEFIYQQTEKELEEYYNSAGQSVKWDKLISSDDRAKKTFLIREEEAVQVWLSHLTADWAVNLTKEVGLSKSMQTFLKASTEISPRQIACVASHASIVPIRAEWLLRGTPILVLIRRFCSKGYHSSFFRVIPDTSAWTSSTFPIKNNRAVDPGKTSWFSIQPVSSKEVCTSSWSTSPHFVLISNSIDGTNGEFYDRIAEDGVGEAGPPWPHESDNCEEHKAYFPKVLESNFSKIVMGFFGQHDQYPFDIVSSVDDDNDVDGHEHVAEKMRAHGFCKGTMKHYWSACKDVEQSGTGEHPWMYTFEHAYTELPFVVGRQVDNIVRTGIKPVPIGYRWWT